MKKDVLKYYGILSLAFLIVYIALRIIGVDITHDEAYSFHNIKKYWYAEFLCTGNSHWLNSAAIALSSFLTFENNYQIRWLTFISAIVFICAILYWTGSLKGRYSKLLAICLILLNPYVLDYFVLARGYALSMALESLSLMFFFYGFKQKSRKHISLSLAFACLSAISQYSFLFYLISFSVIYFYLIYFKSKDTLVKNLWFYLDAIVFLSSIVIIFLAVRFIGNCSNDYLGAGTYSLKDSLISFYNCLVYGSFNGNILVVLLISVLSCLLLLLSLLWGIAKVRHQNASYYYLSVIVCFVLVGILIAKYFFIGVFPEGRSALFLFPLICMVFIYFLDTVIKNVFFQNLLTLGLSIMLLANFILSFNLNGTYDYREQNQSKRIYAFVENIGAKEVGISGELYGVYVNYYLLSKNFNFNYIAKPVYTSNLINQKVDENYLRNFDHLLLYPPYDLSLYKISDLRFEAIKMFEPNKVLLLKVIK